MRRFSAASASVAASASLALTAGLLSTGSTPANAATPKVRPAAAVHWASCKDPDLQAASAVCAKIKVPLDWRRPGGPKITLAISMVRHTSSAVDYQGVMLTNPGGPGGAGLWMAGLGQYVPHGAGDDYDWVGFDPRGVGESRPLLWCNPDYFRGNRPNYVPTSAAVEQAWRHRNRAYSASCGRHGGELLNHLKTVDTVHDMEAIRKALRVSKLNYFGYSYGTYLGQVYATVFPSRVRRMVLDSNVDPRRVWYQANLDQDVAFEKVITLWFSWIAQHNRVYHLGTTKAAVEKRFYATQNSLLGHPAGGVIGPDEWNDIFLSAAYSQSTWADLAVLFRDWVHGRDVAPLIAEYRATDTPGDDTEYAGYNAVQCSDVQWPTRWVTWKKDNDRIYRKARFETWSNAWYNAPCRTWPAKPGIPVKVNGSQAPPILLIDETLDAATPFSGSLWVRHVFPKSRLIAVVGGVSHANSLNGDVCVDDAIAAYLSSGALPSRKAGAGHADRKCRPLPPPSAYSSSGATLGGAQSVFARLARVPLRLL